MEVLVWSVLMMCSATITMSELTADAKQDLACDREQQPAGPGQLGAVWPPWF